MVDGVSAHESFDVSGVTTMKAALTANGPPFGAVPRAGMTHWEDTTLFANPGNARILTPGVLYRVEVDYASINYQTGISPTNPLELPVKYAWADEEETEQIDVDLFGNPLVTSNGDAVDPPAENTFTTKIIIATRWVSQFDLTLASTYEWKVNSNSVTIPLVQGAIPETALLCRSIVPITEYDERATAIQIRGTFALRFKYWDHRFLDVGYRGYYAESGQNIIGEFYTKAGTQISRPVRLNGKGKPYDTNSIQIEKSGKTPIEIGTPSGATIEDVGDAIVLNYFRYKSEDFSGTGFF